MGRSVIPSRARAGTRDTTGEKLRGPCGGGGGARRVSGFPNPQFLRSGVCGAEESRQMLACVKCVGILRKVCELPWAAGAPVSWVGRRLTTPRLWQSAACYRRGLLSHVARFISPPLPGFLGSADSALKKLPAGRATLSRFMRWSGRFSYDAGRPRAPDLLSRNCGFGNPETLRAPPPVPQGPRSFSPVVSRVPARALLGMTDLTFGTARE